MIWRPSELKAFLAEHGLSAQKGLSQHFLIDGNVIGKMVALADKPTTLEIGPGPGGITQELLKAGHKVIAIEKDRALASLLERFQTDDQRLTVEQGDILVVDLYELVDEQTCIVSNLPFQITAPVLSRLVIRSDLFSRMVVLVQDEVARRMTASPRTRDYGSLTLFLQLYANTTYAFKVSRRSFWPSPRVDSAVVVLDLHKPTIDEPEELEGLMRAAFQQRRKMLRRSLGELYGKKEIIAALEKAKLPPQARPEELTLIEFAHLRDRLLGERK